MNDLPRQKLGELLARHGRSLCDDPQRLEALLRDLCPDHRREIAAIVAAVRARVAGEIERSSDSGTLGGRLGVLVRKLEDDAALAPEAARWAVESWAVALGRMPASLHPATSPAGGAPVCAEVAETDPAAALRNANEACQQRDWAGAVMHYEDLLRLVPGHPVGLERLKSCRPKLEAFLRQQAEAQKRATLLAGERVKLALYRETARTYLSEGRPEMALEWLMKIRALDPADPLVAEGAGILDGLLEAERVVVPEGAFVRGNGDFWADRDESPEGHVFVSGFMIDRYEVTNEAFVLALNWAIDCGEALWDGSRVAGPAGQTYLHVSNSRCSCAGDRFAVETGYERHPVVGVTWFGAAAYCNWRSGMRGLQRCYDTAAWTCDFTADGYRLPTEAEWEKAARGTDGRKYPWGDEDPACEQANYTLCGGGTKPVGSCSAGRSPYGAEDMAGNVWEWCNDWYRRDYYGETPGGDPGGPVAGVDRVNRGGGWDTSPRGIRAAYRGKFRPDLQDNNLGFRCAMAILP